MSYFGVVIFSYLIASIPIGLLVSKYFYGIDVRKYGSGNIGATNILRTLGKVPALLVLIGDAAKGVVAVYLGRLLLGNETGAVLGALAALLGHNCSIFLNFKGGKGVATGLGILLMLNPLITFICVGIFTLTVYFTRYVSLGSILAAASLPLLVILGRQPGEHLVFALLAAIFVIFRHHTNIKRLLEGTENKINSKKR